MPPGPDAADGGARPPPGAARSSIATDASSLARLTVLDWIGVLLVVVGALFSFVFPVLVAPAFRALSEALGGRPPALASGLLEGALPRVLALVPVALVLAALGLRQPLARRRLLLVAAFAVTLVAATVYLVGMYATLFDAMGRPSG